MILHDGRHERSCRLTRFFPHLPSSTKTTPSRMDLFTLLSSLRDSLSLSTTSVRLVVYFSCTSLETDPRPISSAVAGSTTNNDRAPSILNAVQLRAPSTLEQIDSYLEDPVAKDRIHTSLHIVFSCVLFPHLFPAAVLTLSIHLQGRERSVRRSSHHWRRYGQRHRSRSTQVEESRFVRRVASTLSRLFLPLVQELNVLVFSFEQVPTIFSFSPSKVSFPVSDSFLVLFRLFPV